jgi:hypothetical protein
MKKILLIIVIGTLLFGCKSKLKPRELGVFEYKTSGVSITNDRIIVTSWGFGKTKEECMASAFKKAIKDVVFKGIIDGNPACKKPPILTKVNAEKEYQSFFEAFLSEKGKYLNYAEIYGEPRSQSHSKKMRKLDRVLNIELEFQILIDRNGLVKLLQQPTIINN